MRSALAMATALAVCCIVFEATSSEAKAPSVTTLIETVKHLTERVEVMERSRAEDQRRIGELDEKVETVRYADDSDDASVVESTSSVSGAPTGQGNLLNPEITVFLDMGGSLSIDDDNKARNRPTSILTGRLLFAEWGEIGAMALLFGAVALLHFALRRRFLEISLQSRTHASPTRRQKLLDFVFYSSFGVVVRSSVQLSGVLVVFGLLIVPAWCAAIFFTSISSRLLASWAIGTISCTAGIAASALWDLPTGAAVASALGAAFSLAVIGSILPQARG